MLRWPLKTEATMNFDRQFKRDRNFTQMVITRALFDEDSDETWAITISNDGAEITSTNYFDSPWAHEGLCYLSGNAGEARLLIPDSQQNTVSLIHTRTFCVLTTGLYMATPCIEIMFQGKFAPPFAVGLTQEMCDFSIQPSRMPFKLSAWTRNGKVGEWTAFERAAKRLPYLQPWK